MKTRIKQENTEVAEQNSVAILRFLLFKKLLVQ